MTNILEQHNAETTCSESRVIFSVTMKYLILPHYLPTSYKQLNKHYSCIAPELQNASASINHPSYKQT
uniref:Uncharacterized protein n=1 Tax=Arundo donax TaxID=35708 RepID=A0A0A8ZC22_ARUDO